MIVQKLPKLLETRPVNPPHTRVEPFQINQSPKQELINGVERRRHRGLCAITLNDSHYPKTSLGILMRRRGTCWDFGFAALAA